MNFCRIELFGRGNNQCFVTTDIPHCNKSITRAWTKDTLAFKIDQDIKYRVKNCVRLKTLMVATALEYL